MDFNFKKQYGVCIEDVAFLEIEKIEWDGLYFDKRQRPKNKKVSCMVLACLPSIKAFVDAQMKVLSKKRAVRREKNLFSYSVYVFVAFAVYLFLWTIFYYEDEFAVSVVALITVVWAYDVVGWLLVCLVWYKKQQWEADCKGANKTYRDNKF